MATYLSPGVYVEEVPSAIKTIAGVSTSTAAFVGIVPDKVTVVAPNPSFDPTDAESSKGKFVDFTVPTDANVSVLITSWSQFTDTFGDILGAGGATQTDSTATAVTPGFQQLAHAVYGFFNNGGSRCYVARIIDESGLDVVLNKFAAQLDIAIVCAPGLISANVRDKIVAHCAATKDRFAILDGPEVTDHLDALTRIASDNSGLMPNKTDLAAWYYPWIKVFDPGTQMRSPKTGGEIAVPPSGHIAGIYARVDTERGVFKSPANEVIRGALDVTHALSKADQDGLNPKGVNAIRVLNDNIYVWGARTIGGDANTDLKYISVRRTLLFLRESIDEGTQWAVFEPNTPALWAKISRNVTEFLTTVWRSGALFGTTTKEAFFVKCDAETNKPDSRDRGEVVTEIGVAIARPAEFVIFRVSQFSAPTA